MRARLILSCALTLAGAGAPGAAQRARDESGSKRSQSFALPLVRDALTLANEAEGHLAARRWNEGLAALQRLIEDHHADVLPDSWRRSAERSSRYLAYPGAAAWAEATLFGIEEEARRLYRDRYQPGAELALERARSEGSRGALVDLTRRWPICPAAGRAWCAIGDMELERGHLLDARISYTRARRIDELWGVPTDKLEDRISRAEALSTEPASERSLPVATPKGPRSRTDYLGGAVPSGDADTWAESFQLGVNPLQEHSNIDHYNLFPVLDGERIFVSTSFDVFAIDAFSGDELWRAERHAGWKRLSDDSQKMLMEAVADEELILSPAVGGNVVVAGLQIPYSQNGKDAWQGINIMHAIPERRLVAFDASTGEELWNHAPPLVWDGRRDRFSRESSSGSYAERMLVAAPPVVVGSRVLVPCYRMSGRIEYHVACYDLETGERLWATALVSGQRETNMFGRLGGEFASSPLAVADDRVVAVTELGTVAALDLVSGRILWESLYEQMPLPKTVSYNPPHRSAVWRLSAPVIEDGVVLCTPSDSKSFVAFLLEDGRVPWSMSHVHLEQLHRQTRHLRFNVLLGADDDTVYLGGERLAALQKPGGLASPEPFRVRWVYPFEENRNPLGSPRSALGRDSIVVPMREERLVIDKRSGQLRRQLSGEWSYQDCGNVLIGDGALYTLNRHELDGHFDWETQLTRAEERMRQAPGDARLAVETARLITRRAAQVHSDGDSRGALALFGKARGLLEPLWRAGAIADGDRDVAEALYEVLRHEGLARADTADTPGALELLERARSLAPDRAALRDTLLQEERILRHRGPEQWLAVLALLEEGCADLSMPPERRDAALDWLIGEALLEPADLSGWQETGVPVDLWVLLTRAAHWSRSQQGGRALEDLHQALARHGQRTLVGSMRVSDLVSQRIGRRLELDGPANYAPFEARAERAFAAAIEAGDRAALERLASMYPHSTAAAEAHRTRLSWAYQARDADEVVAIAYASLSQAPRASRADALVLLRVASVLGDAGNAAFEREMLRSLAAEHPALISDLEEHAGRTLAQLAEEAATHARPDATRLSTFDASVRATGTISGKHYLIGKLPAAPFAQETASAAAHVYLKSNSLRAISAANPTEFLWPPVDLKFHPKPELCEITETRIVAGGRRTLMALDHMGQEVWRHDLGERVATLDTHAGVLVALVGPPTGPDRIVAFDANGGTPLWSLALPRGSNGWRPAVCGEGSAVFFSSQLGRPTRAMVVDLARGVVRVTIEFERDVASRIHRSAWIEDGKLLVPSFSTRRQDSGLSAYDLDSGELSWDLGFPRGEELFTLAHCEGENYLLTVAAQLGEDGSGGVYHLEDVRLGALRSVVTFKPHEEPMGLRPERRVELEAPYLFLYSPGRSGNTTPIRAIHLPYETRWGYSLPVPYEELYDGLMPMPAVSANNVAIAYQTHSDQLPDGARLIFLDKHTGLPLDKRDLDLGAPDTIELVGMGSALCVVGRGRGGAANQIKILEVIR